MCLLTQLAILPSAISPLATRSVRSVPATAAPSTSIPTSTVLMSFSGRKPQPANSCSISFFRPGSPRNILVTARSTSSEWASAGTSAPRTASIDAGMADIPSMSATASAPCSLFFDFSLQPAAATSKAAAAKHQRFTRSEAAHAAAEHALHALERLRELLELRAAQAELHDQVLVDLLDDRLLDQGLELRRQLALHGADLLV